MNYFFIALITTSGAAIIIYFLLNRVLHTKIQVVPLILCATCSLFLSMALPKFIVRYTDWIGTLAVLALFSLLFAYFLAYYDEVAANKQVELEDSGECLIHAANPSHNLSDEVAASLEPFESSRSINEPVDTNTNSCLPVSEPDLQLEIPAENLCIDSEPIVVETADEMLDRAFRLKELRDYKQAARLFQNVLQLNTESSAAALLLLEIADALSHSGEFEAAKKVLVAGLSYPSVTGTLGEEKIRAMIASLEQSLESESTWRF